MEFTFATFRDPPCPRCGVHWMKLPGESVDPDFFSPPIPPVGEPILEVLAFHHARPNGQRFVREKLGAPWVYSPVVQP
jgi:hypothetical protein